MSRQRLGSFTRLLIWIGSALTYALWMMIGVHRDQLVNEVLSNTGEMIIFIVLAEFVAWTIERYWLGNITFSWRTALGNALIGVLMWLVVILLVGIVSIGVQAVGFQFPRK